MLLTISDFTKIRQTCKIALKEQLLADLDPEKDRIEQHHMGLYMYITTHL
jgi:hypothetical protein